MYPERTESDEDEEPCQRNVGESVSIFPLLDRSVQRHSATYERIVGCLSIIYAWRQMDYMMIDSEQARTGAPGPRNHRSARDSQMHSQSNISCPTLIFILKRAVRISSFDRSARQSLLAAYT